MIDFIIVEDNFSYLFKYKTIIEKVMMNYDIEYDMTIYDKYSSSMKTFLKKEKFKIYLISYSERKKSKELIEYIREELDDWQSLIILFYEKAEDITELEKESLFLIDVISLQKDFSNKLKRALQICLKNYDQRPNTLKYCYKKVFYNIEYWKIIYIEKESETKRCQIKTIDKSYYIPGCLSQLEKSLDNRFMKCNRSYIINLEQVESYNSKDNSIVFKNEEILNTISRDKKKDIINYFRGLEK